MRGPHNLIRLIRTGATFERTGAMRVMLDASDASMALRYSLRVLAWPFRWLGLKGDESMPPVPRALTALGPAYIKFGQILSTRPDIIGNDLALELRVLQDQLPPFSNEDAKAMIERDLGAPIEQLFETFSPPVAAASLAQVHEAKIAKTGEHVAVKVLRPNIGKAFKKDIDAFYFAAHMIEFLSPSSRRLRPLEIVRHFDGVVQGELNLFLEASSASEFYENTQGDEGFCVPKVNWGLTGRQVMTLGWADGISIGDRDALIAAGHDVSDIAKRILQIFLKHALRDGFFHGDMHHGNLKIAANSDIIAYDFGIMGQIDEYTRRVYAEILYGFIRRDYVRVAQVHFEAGYVPAHQDQDAFARALRAVGEPIFGMGASSISMANLLSYLFEVTERFGMETRTELILLQRTMVIVEGVARSLDEDTNIWDNAQPVVEQYIKDNLGPKAMARDMVKVATVLSRFAPRLPDLTQRFLRSSQDVAPPPTVSKGQVLLYVALSAACGGALMYLVLSVL